jgi:hypothetical protein
LPPDRQTITLSPQALGELVGFVLVGDRPGAGVRIWRALAALRFGQGQDDRGIHDRASLPVGPNRAPAPALSLARMHSDPAEQSRITRRLVELRLEHRDLDAAIARLQADTLRQAAHARDVDELAVKRLKKRKLQLKDAIAKLESALIPDLDA